MSLFLAIILLLLAIGGVVVRKTYCYLPIREMKRRAEKNDPLASKIYPAAAYGSSLRALLWLYIGLTTAASLVLLARILPIWASLLIVGPILWVAFSWLPSSRVTKVGAKLTIMVTPVVTSMLNYLHPLLGRSSEAVRKHSKVNDHTGYFEKDDLIKLIEQLEWQKDSRFTPEELEIARRALSFDKYKIADILSHKKIKTTLTGDTIGPVLIDELHASGQEHILVLDKKGGEAVGVLEFSRLGIDSKGKVADLMDTKVYYLHENDSLSQALHAFFVTNHPTFIVVNNFEERVGIISIENVLHQLLGHVPGEDFDQFADLKAVAARHPKVKKTDEASETPVKNTDKVLE